jgi:serine phosphatase RsbU (regulator of sigma subunit)
MRLLVGWDAPAELDLLQMYLQVDENQVTFAEDAADLVARFNAEPWDVVLLPSTWPDHAASFEVFSRIHRLDPRVPVLLAVRPGEIYPLARFIRHGLRWHVYRDEAGEFMFLLQTLMESCVEARRAEEYRSLAHRLREEIDAVRRLQESILPKDLRCPPKISAVARYEPSQIHVSDGSPVVLAGGDYYHVFSIDDHRMIVLVGDASGHGIKACLSIMSMHTLINQLQRDFDRPPHEFVAEINRRLCTHELVQGDGGFITLIYGILDRGVFRWTSAGHCMPVIHNLQTGEIIPAGDQRHDSGPPLAIFEDAEYETRETVIPPGHRLCIYTDGLIEAFPGGESHRQFGVDGLYSTLRRHADKPLDQTLESLFRESYEYTEGIGRHDDTSVLLLENTVA